MRIQPTWQYLICLLICCVDVVLGNVGLGEVTEEERLNLRDEAKEMFYHAYNAYMANAYPADELMPLSCKGRFRDTQPSRGDVDDTLGNFSLTLVDSLDTLVILGDLDEFERAVKLVIKDVSFDHDLDVSVFETNIRMVGGLLSGHIMAEHMTELHGVLTWYRGELLTMARDLASRLLPAFNTTTGIPHPRVNLKHGMKSPKLLNSRETCTACAGTIILEFAALSRLTGDSIFEEKARLAMDYLWTQRHRSSDLVGTVLNIHSGDWVRRDSGVGAGIDSYYEYLLKAYVLLGDDSFLQRFNKHYSAVMKYVSQGPMLLDVHMHRPHTTSRNFMDALLAFWPGLQVLKGDIKPAIETHEMLFQVIQRHNFLPEAFTTDFQVHWGQYPLRPEFVESTYLVYQATGDSYYLRVGEHILKSLQKHTWVPCGYAAVKDVRTGAHEDRMDSFVLAETFKYLYLLFSKPNELLINLDDFIFTTEAHLLPLSLARLSNITAQSFGGPFGDVPLAIDDDVVDARSCPNVHFLFPSRHDFAENIRRPLKNFVNNVCPSRKTLKRQLRATEFQAGNIDHMALLKKMGISIVALPDGRVQLLHTSTSAKTSEDAEEGLLFMQEMIELSKVQQDQPDNPPRAVTFHTEFDDGSIHIVTIKAGPAQFGLELKDGIQVTGELVKASPLRACGSLQNSDELQNKIVVMERGDCMFAEKARLIESLGAVGGIVLDNNEGSSANSSPMFAMSGDGTDDVSIPLVFLFSADAQPLLETMEKRKTVGVVLSDHVVDANTGFGSVEEVMDEDAKNVLISSGNSPAIPQLHVTLLHGDDSVTANIDDLVRIVKDDSAVTGPTIEEEIKQHIMDAMMVELNEADSVDKMLKAATRYVYIRQQLTQPSKEPLVSELMQLLLKKTGSDAQLLHQLLSVHLQQLRVLFELASASGAESDSSVNGLVNQLEQLTQGEEPDGVMLTVKADSNLVSESESATEVIDTNGNNLVGPPKVEL